MDYISRDILRHYDLFFVSPFSYAYFFFCKTVLEVALRDRYCRFSFVH